VAELEKPVVGEGRAGRGRRERRSVVGEGRKSDMVSIPVAERGRERGKFGSSLTQRI
jgi:hypothetical protein